MDKAPLQVVLWIWTLAGHFLELNVIEAGTNNGVVTDFDGNFSITVAKNQGTLELSYVGYQTKTVSYTLSGETLALGSISVNQAAASLDEVILIGSGVIQVAEGRRTPVAVSTIRAEEISTKAAGNVEFTEAMKNTPICVCSKSRFWFRRQSNIPTWF